MKRIIFSLCLLFLFASTSEAAWTIATTKVFDTEHYIYFKVTCTSDGSTLTATNILVASSTAEAVVTVENRLFDLISGRTAMIMDVIPGTAGVIPNTTIDIAFSNELITYYDESTFSKDANTVGNSLAKDYNQYPVISGQMNIILNDIGDSGDQVTLAFLCWKEGGSN